MKLSYRLFAALASLAVAASFVPASAQTATLPNVTYQATEVITLWPGSAPGETGRNGPESIVPERPRPFDQITNVSVPTLAVFQPTPEKRTGTGILLIPGGGLERLALEHEGYEAAEWLNEQGITVFLLKYRVPPRDPAQRWKVGLQDAQRAMGLIRANAVKWEVDADSIGSLGFSAGVEINLMLSVYDKEPRQYPPVDAADSLSTRPDFNIAIYGGGFADPQANALRPDIASRVGKDTPPMFIAHAFDDQALSSVILMNALKRANIASELHIFGAGGHGFGVRDTGLPVGHWRELCLDWLAWQGYLDAPEIRSFARDFAAASAEGSTVRRFSRSAASAGEKSAYAAQRRVVRQIIRSGGVIAGYKGTCTSSRAPGPVSPPMHGVLFKSGRIDAATATPLPLDPQRPVLIEAHLGFVIAVDIGTKLRVPRQAVSSVEAVVPVIELPFLLQPLLGDKMVALDAIAANFGSNRTIVGQPVAPKTIADLDALAVSLQRDGRTFHETTGGDVLGGQAQNLMTLINQIVDDGHVIRRGDVILCGALGGAKPGEKGRYTAAFGPLGTLTFELQ